MDTESYNARKEYLETLRETLELIDEPNADFDLKIDSLRRTVDGLIKDRELALEPYFLLQEQVDTLTELVLNLSSRM